MSATVSLLFATFASEEGGHAAATWMGVPLWIWQSINLVLFFFLLYQFVVRKLIDHFRQRQLDLEQRLRLAEQQRRDAQNVAAEIRERMAKVEREMDVIRAQGRADGEVEKEALFERAQQEAHRAQQPHQVADREVAVQGMQPGGHGPSNQRAGAHRRTGDRRVGGEMAGGGRPVRRAVPAAGSST